MVKHTWTYRVGVVALVVLLTTGCGPTANTNEFPETKSSTVRSVDPQRSAAFVDDRNGDTIDRTAPAIEDRDYIMGRNANPNLVIGHQAVRGQAPDMRALQETAKSVQGVEDARVTLSGGNAYITLDLIPNVSANQARLIERQVLQAVKVKVPRYQFHVTSYGGYHR